MCDGPKCRLQPSSSLSFRFFLTVKASIVTIIKQFMAQTDKRTFS